MKSLKQKNHDLSLIPAESDLDSPLSHLNSWQIAYKVISKSNWWQIFLITIGSASSIIYPHVPFVGFAAVAQK